MDGDHQDEPIGLPHPRFGAIEQSDVECPERPGLVVVSVGYEGPGSGKQMGHIVETFGRWHAASGLLEPVAQVHARARPEAVIPAVRATVEDRKRTRLNSSH